MNMYKLSIGEDTADLLIRDVIIQDYSRVYDSIVELESRIDELKPFQLEDLANDREILAALAVMLKYYLPWDEAHEVINKKANRAS
jgi:hypothetical protein